MFSAEFAGRTADVLERLDSVLDELISLDLSAGSDDQLIDLLTGAETRVRRFAAVDHALIGEADDRRLGVQRGCSNTTAFLGRLLGIGVEHARLRVRAAEHLAPRRTLTGEVLQPEFPATAAAQAEGAISVEHARVITSTIKALPASIREEKFDEIEPDLADYARQFGVDQFRMLARHLGAVLDPDGTLRDAKYRDRLRAINVRQRPDGSVSGSFEGTAEFGEALLAVLDKFAAPKPEANGVKDPRTPAQRRHDGLLDAMKMLLRSGELGDCNGVSTTILMTMTAEQAQNGAGLARTGHGASVPVQDVLANIGDARIFPVIFADEPAAGPPEAGPPAGAGPPETGPPGGEPQISRLFPRIKPVAAYGTTQRIFTEGQRLAMIARDRGCSFPGCTSGPAWCEAHHVTEWQFGKRTCIDDATLLCGYHHREFEKLNWRCQMIDGVPHFVPPFWLDPDRRPIRNTVHDIPAA